jgi:hypothetical protein
MSIINALVDHGHSHESELFADVIASHNEIVTSLEKQLAECRSVIAAKDEALDKMLKSVPASGPGGAMMIDHHSIDGEYIGTEYVDPMAVIQDMYMASEKALAIKPSDVELVEIGTVAKQSTYLDEILMAENENTLQVEPGTVLYVLKQKEGANVST